jgi:hypothetical protein
MAKLLYLGHSGRLKAVGFNTVQSALAALQNTCRLMILPCLAPFQLPPSIAGTRMALPTEALALAQNRVQNFFLESQPLSV